MAQDYRQASRDIWDRMAGGWDDDRRWIWDASRPVGEWLVDALDPLPGGAPRSSGSRTCRMDAERMDLDDASVDGVVCRWGYMLMADPVAALRETRRVLRPGGRVALSVWSDPKANLWASVPAAALTEHTGQEPPDPHAPGSFAIASEERTRELLTEAGRTPRRMEHVEMEWSVRIPDDHWHYVMDTG